MLARPPTVPTSARNLGVVPAPQRCHQRLACVSVQHKETDSQQPNASTPAAAQPLTQSSDPALAPGKAQQRRQQHMDALVFGKLEAMVGWKVLLQRSGAYIGTIEEARLLLVSLTGHLYPWIVLEHAVCAMQRDQPQHLFVQPPQTSPVWAWHRLSRETPDVHVFNMAGDGAR